MPSPIIRLIARIGIQDNEVVAEHWEVTGDDGLIHNALTLFNQNDVRTQRGVLCFGEWDEIVRMYGVDVEIGWLLRTFVETQPHWHGAPHDEWQVNLAWLDEHLARITAGDQMPRREERPIAHIRRVP